MKAYFITYIAHAYDDTIVEANSPEEAKAIAENILENTDYISFNFADAEVDIVVAELPTKK